MAKRKPMTLDEAIEHALERSHQDCSECAREHAQLAEWLSELKELREKQKSQSNDIDMTEQIPF